MSEFRIFLCNISSDEADQLARKLVELRVCACVNVIPGVKSFYHWQGKLCEDRESTLLIKTTEACVGDLRKAIEEHHPYSVPEFLSVPINDLESGAAYLKWLRDAIRPQER